MEEFIMDIQWPLVFFTLLTGLGAGTFFLVALTEWLGKAEAIRMPGAITALAAIVIGGIISVLHLGHPERALNAFGHMSSGVSQEMLLVGIGVLVVLVYIIMMRVGASAQARKVVGAIGMVVAVIMGIVLGMNYVLPARPAWNTPLLPLVYLASAGVLGLFTFYIWSVVKGKKEEANLMGINRATWIVLVVQAVFIVGYVIFLAVAPHPDQSRSVLRLLAGDIALAFWLGVVVVGLVVPLALTIRFQTAKEKACNPLSVAAVGLACVLVGGGVFRAIMYMLGSSIAQFL